MRDIFDFPDEESRFQYIKYALKKYEGERGLVRNEDCIIAYTCLVVHYIVAVRPKSEHTIYSVMKLAGASMKEPGFRAPFWSIVHRYSLQHPEDELFQAGQKVERVFTNEDLEDFFAFLEWNLMEVRDEEEKEKLLGHLTYCRIRYIHNRPKKVAFTAGKRKHRGRPVSLSGEEEKYQKFLEKYTPEKIKSYLDEYVIGQDEAKETLSLAVYNHYLRLLYPEEKLLKNNVVMIGPSGCGKTELIRRISQLVDVPVATCDFSGIVATPWKGRNKEEALLNLYLKADRNIELAERGILFLDEFDKIIPSRKSSRGSDINDELQGQLLGMLEGTMVDVPFQSKEQSREMITMNTENILFVCAGAFEGLEELVQKDRKREGDAFGLASQKQKDVPLNSETLTMQHLMDYGMKTELAGRLSNTAVLQKLDRDTLRRVLTEPKDSILEKYKNEFRTEDDLRLTFTDEALEAIVDQVSHMDIGARGLNAVLHSILQEALFYAPTAENLVEVIITSDVVQEGKEPRYIYL